MSEVVYDSPEITVLYYGNAKATILDGLVKDVQISGDLAKECRTCEISLINTEDGRKKVIAFQPGKEVRVLAGKDELFRGVIFNAGISDSGDQTLTIYDYNVYLSKSKDSIKFVNKTASAIIKQLCSKFGIKTGTIHDTKYVIPKLILRDKTIYEMVVIALTETRKKTGDRYFIRNKAGALELIEVKSQTKFLYVEAGRNLLSASFSESIEDRKTQVKMTGGDEEKPVTALAKSASASSKYGILQHYEHNNDVKDAAKLQEVADGLLKELNKTQQEFSIEALGMVDFVSGLQIKVSDAMTGITGAFYIAADSHSFGADRYHKMSLTLKRQLELPEIEYEEPQSNSKANGADGAKFENIIYETGWKATAYAPALGGINGSGTGLTASGTKVVEGRTIAVDPSVIPLGSVVAIYIPSAKEYSGIYLAEDTGGAIKGKKVDIAVVPTKAKAFGVKNIQVSILTRGSGRSDARKKASGWNTEEKKWQAKLDKLAGSGSAKESTTKQKDVVAIAKTFKGKLKYSFGGKNIGGGSGDCSGFTYYVFNKVGVNIGHGTSTQLTKGTKVSKANAQPGDLVFFQGTYRSGVSHVGIVTQSGSFINLGSSGCYEASYTSGYWATHFMEIRRVL